MVLSSPSMRLILEAKRFPSQPNFLGSVQLFFPPLFAGGQESPRTSSHCGGGEQPGGRAVPQCHCCLQPVQTEHYCGPVQEHLALPDKDSNVSAGGQAGPCKRELLLPRADPVPASQNSTPAKTSTGPFMCMQSEAGGGGQERFNAAIPFC